MAQILGGDPIHTGDGLYMAQDDAVKPLDGALRPFPVTDASTKLLGAGSAEQGRGVGQVFGA